MTVYLDLENTSGGTSNNWGHFEAAEAGISPREIELVATPSTVSKGEEFTVEVRVKNPYGIAAFGFDLEYDIDRFGFNDIIWHENGILTKDFCQVGASENIHGKVRVGGFSKGSDNPILSKESGILLKIKLKARTGEEVPTGEGIISINNFYDDIETSKSVQISVVIQ